MAEFDRDYRFLIRTFDGPAVDLDSLARDAAEAGLAGWACTDGVVAVDGYCKVGDLELRTDGGAARDWRYCLVSEFDAGRPTPQISAAAIAQEAQLLATRGLELLSVEAAVRPAGAGTAIPRPSGRWPSFPDHFEAAIEYIEVPEGRWDDYRLFMRDTFGPVGQRLVEQGDSYIVRITEIGQVYFRDESLPAWNRIHILTGDFSNPQGGFFEGTAKAVRGVVGPQHSIESALGLASYRRKPRMSRNRLAFSQRMAGPQELGS